MPEFGSAANGQFSPETLYGLDVTGPTSQIGASLTLRDDLSVIRGRHAFKMGYEVIRDREDSSVAGVPSGDFLFDNMTSGLQTNGQPIPNTGNDFAGFLFSSVSQTNFSEQLQNWLPRDTIQGVYFQDDWKVSAHLTLNLGIRYDNESPYHVKDQNGESNFDPNAIDPLTGKMGALVNPNGNLSKRDNHNFQPRVGLAWHPFNKWVFRGGFALNTVDIKFPVARGQFDDEVAQATQQQPPGNPLPLYQLSQGPNPLQYDINSSGVATFVGTNYSNRNVSYWDPNMHNAYVLNWNATIEYAFKANYLLSLSYTGSAGVGLVENWDINTMPSNFGANNPTLRAAAFAAPQNYLPYPQFGAIDELSNWGHSTYHAGTVKVEKRYSHGMTFTASYTRSKAIGDTDSNSVGSPPAESINDLAIDKGVAGFNRTNLVVGDVTYELPIGLGKPFLNRGSVWNLIFGGYGISWIQSFQSGLPMTFTFANSPNNYFPTYAGTRYPNITPECKPTMYSNWKQLMASSTNRFNEAAINGVISMSCFSYPAAFTEGDAGRNIVTGPGLIATAISVKKTIRVRERYTIQVRLDMNNPFKSWAFSNPTSVVDYTNPRLFGKITSVPQTSPGAFGGAPLMDLAVKFSWYLGYAHEEHPAR